MELLLIFWVPFLLYIGFKLYKSVRIVSAQDVILIERLGKYNRTIGAGFHLLIPFFEKDAYHHTLKEQAIDVHPQSCITRDNVVVQVDGVLYIRVVDPVKASYSIHDYRYSAIQLAQTTMRAIIGTMDLDKTFEERAYINSRIMDAVDYVAERWGVKVHRYEIVNISPPQSVMAAMEREKRAQINKEAEMSISQGDRDSRINRSLGQKEELINHSIGEKQKRINAAEARAQEIEAIAFATAGSIEKIAEALQVGDGMKAMELQVSQKLIDEMQQLAKHNTEVVLPVDLTNFDQTIQRLLRQHQ